MLTVREALDLPVFATSRLVAGHAGLDNQIQWVHIVDIPEAQFEWRRRGVLLLTAGYGLRDNAERQAALVPKLVEKGFAGIVLSIGYYFDETPPVIREAADSLSFPVIETPPELLFIEITEAIFERIVNQHYAVLQQSTRIHTQLTELVLQGGNLNDLATTLAHLLARSITIEDTAFRVLAAAQHGPVDEARERSLANGRTTPELAQRLLDAGIYDRLLAQMGPVRVAPLPELGMNMERFVAPIIVDREIYGYIWILAGDHPLTDLDELAIGHAATVAALILFKEKAVREAEESLRGDLLEQLLRGDGDLAVLAEQARRLNYRTDRPHQILLIHGPTVTGGNNRSLLDDVEQWLRTCSRDGRLPSTFPLLVWREQHLVIVLESDDPAKGKQLAAALVQALSHPARYLLIGVGSTVQPTKGQTTRLRQSYQEAEEAIQIGRALGRYEGVSAFDELGVMHWLHHLPTAVLEGNSYLKHIHTLVAYDSERHTDLLKTLEAYLDHGCSLVEAAQVLFIHRNTLLHRLERIQELCPVDLRQPLQRLNLHVAVKSYRLHR